MWLIAVGVAVLAVILWFVFKPGHHHHAHHASCWAKPGRFVAGGHGKFVYSSSGRRHGAGSRVGICDGK